MARTIRTVEIFEQDDGWLVAGSGLFGNKRFETAVEARQAVTDDDASRVAADGICVTTINWHWKTSIGRLVVEVLTDQPSRKKAKR